MKEVLIVILLSIVSFQVQALEKIDLPNSRTSMEYAPQVRSFINKVENYKWESSNGEGLHIVQTSKPYAGEFTDQNIYVQVKKFYYGEQVADSLQFVIQSRYVGYLDFKDHETSISLAIRTMPDGSIETYSTQNKNQIFKTVEQWSKNPDPIEDLPSAEERGLVY